MAAAGWLRIDAGQGSPIFGLRHWGGAKKKIGLIRFDWLGFKQGVNAFKWFELSCL
jgi:hypothetical protein